MACSSTDIDLGEPRPGPSGSHMFPGGMGGYFESVSSRSNDTTRVPAEKSQSSTSLRRVSGSHRLGGMCAQVHFHTSGRLDSACHSNDRLLTARSRRSQAGPKYCTVAPSVHTPTTCGWAPRTQVDLVCPMVHRPLLQPSFRRNTARVVAAQPRG